MGSKQLFLVTIIMTLGSNVKEEHCMKCSSFINDQSEVQLHTFAGVFLTLKFNRSNGHEIRKENIDKHK